MNVTTSSSEGMSSAEVKSENTFVKQDIADDVGLDKINILQYALDNLK